MPAVGAGVVLSLVFMASAKLLYIRHVLHGSQIADSSGRFGRGPCGLIMHCPSCGRSDLKMEIQGSRAENSVGLLRSGVFVVFVIGGWSVWNFSWVLVNVGFCC